MPTMPNSTFCQAIPAQANVASNSSAIISWYANNYLTQITEGGGGSGGGWMYQLGQTSPSSAYAHRDAYFIAIPSDAQYTIQDDDTSSASLTGQVLQMPAGAQPEGGLNCPIGMPGEGHMAVMQPDNKTIYEFSNVECITPGAGGLPGLIHVNGAFYANIALDNGWACGNPYEYPAGCVGDSITASHRDVTQGIISAREILNGGIYHALSGTFGCSSGHMTPPAQGFDNPCSSTGSAIAEGQKLFIAACSTYPHCTSAQSAATIASWGNLGLTVPGQMILDALAGWGIYYTDSYGGPSAYFEPLDPESYGSAHAITDYWPQVVSKYNLQPYPNGGTQNWGYSLNLAAVPTNPNGPPGAKGFWSWFAVCSLSGC